MHGLIPINFRLLSIQKTILRYFSRSAMPLRSKDEKIGREGESLVERPPPRRMNPFGGEHNEPISRFLHHIGFHGFELYPIQLQMFAWAIVLVLITYYSSAKIEVIYDRSYENNPFIFAALKGHDYDHVAFISNLGTKPQRLELMETLQTEMITEAIKRGTR